MESKFSIEEKKKYMLKKHIKNHLLEYFIDFITPILLVLLALSLGNAKNYFYGIVCSVIYSVINLLYHIRNYKKDYIDNETK